MIDTMHARTVAAFVSKAPVVIKAFQKYLLPLIDERRRLVVQHSDEPEWDDKPVSCVFPTPVRSTYT